MTTKKTAKKTTAKKTSRSTTKSATSKTATPKTVRKRAASAPHLPAVGSTISRTYKGRAIEVKVLADGFEFEGETYRSLSGLAKHITGYPAISGPAFFKLTGEPETE